MVSRESFLAIFPEVVESLSDWRAGGDASVRDAYDRIKYILEYNVPNGKLTRGLTLVSAYKLLRGGSATELEMKRASYLGWAVEIMQAFFLVADDIMDHSITRRGKLCWYKVDGIGLDAVNDAFFLEQLTYRLFKKHFAELPCFIKLYHLFHDITFQTVLGQSLDLSYAPIGKVDLDKFTEDKYKAIVLNKTAAYTIYLPVAAALIYAEKDSELSIAQAKGLSDDIGSFFQIQDDFLDVYGDPEVTGKIGTDIEDNKCSWLIIEALKLCSPEQRKILESNYGINDPTCAAKVKDLFVELDLKGHYCKFEEESYLSIKTKLSTVKDPALVSIFQSLCDKLFKRLK